MTKFESSLKKPKKNPKVLISVRLEPSIYAAAETMAKKHGLRITQVIQDAVKFAFLEDQKEIQDRFSVANQARFKK